MNNRQRAQRTTTEAIQSTAQRPLLDTRAAGHYTGLGERYIRRLRAARSVPCIRIGGRLLFDPDDLDELIARHRQPAIPGMADEQRAII